MTMTRRNKGFTLIELMITVVIVGIIAAVALPSYQASVRKSRRADATTTLLQLQLAQERRRANNPTYANALNLLGLTPTGGVFSSPNGHYTLTMASTDGYVLNYTITATAAGNQAADTCATFVINQDGPVIANAAQQACWAGQ